MSQVEVRNSIHQNFQFQRQSVGSEVVQRKF